MLNINTAKIG